MWYLANAKSYSKIISNNISLVLFKRRLDYIFISQNFQEVAKYTEILNAISTDHSPVLCSFRNLNQFQRGPGLWKFNNSPVSNKEYVWRLKELINKIKGKLKRRNQFCDQVKWAVLKYEIRWFTINFSKDLAKTKKSKQCSLENQLKVLKSNLNCDINTVEYINCKNQLEEIYDDIAESKKVRSKPNFF